MRIAFSYRLRHLPSPLTLSFPETCPAPGLPNIWTICTHSGDRPAWLNSPTQTVMREGILHNFTATRPQPCVTTQPTRAPRFLSR